MKTSQTILSDEYNKIRQYEGFNVPVSVCKRLETFSVVALVVLVLNRVRSLLITSREA